MGHVREKQGVFEKKWSSVLENDLPTPSPGHVSRLCAELLQSKVLQVLGDLEIVNKESQLTGSRSSLVGGLVAISYFPIYWESHHPN